MYCIVIASYISQEVVALFFTLQRIEEIIIKIQIFEIMVVNSYLERADVRLTAILSTYLRPRLNIPIFLLILGWKYSYEYA